MQKLSLSIFFSGLTAFLTSLGEFFIYHHSWSSMSEPREIGHIVLMTASFCMTITGALGIQLPRSTRFEDRISDKKLDEIHKENEK